MLAGLAGLAVPILLHLIARHRFPVQDFPTIRLLAREKHTNVFAPKLIDPLQLLLRLLVVALLVFAMARLFRPTATEEAAPHNLVVVMDASASMNMEVVDPREIVKLTVNDEGLLDVTAYANLDLHRGFREALGELPQAEARELT